MRVSHSRHLRPGRAAAAVAAATAIPLLLAGCGDNGGSGGGTSAGGVVNLTVLTGFTGPDAPSYQALVKQFNATHPKIHVTMTAEPWSAIGQKLPASWATGQGPDLATPSSDPGSIFTYIKTNSVLPLDSSVGTGPNQIDSAAFPPSVKSAFTVDGKLYAVPANMATLVLYYNKDMFAAAGITRPPATEAEFIADAKKLTTGSGGKPSQYGLSLADNNTIQMWPILQWMNGGDIVGQDGCAVVNSPASVAALTRWSQLVDKDHISPVGQAGADADTLFSSKKAAMEINGPWAAAGFRSAGVDLGIAQVPVGSAGPVTLASTVPLMVARTSKHQEQAKEFLAWYTGKTAQAQFSKLSGFPPARTDLDAASAGNPTVAEFAKALPHAKLYLAGQSNATRIDTDVYVPLIQKIERGADVKGAADDAARTIDSLTGCHKN
ncbi:ABC transporter substrate-binding protein [Actinacidiphila sp. DG2A-62]|uniref:ABC transporter substrate-binding protein n=1 Tax=Actinacidiphila sp. DG2A-62 TaxID=3108821 RepID=UPI002DBD8129|nr:ABC transporter substrate-binding protein [Actinacidiphila sp. DG2A-62]MEC3992437.1 ABC transporter substrate-binding protein [Actinacidiphila sp. DG2A-62]